MRDARLYVARRPAAWPVAERNLRRAFDLVVEARPPATRSYLDTFDGRLYRAGLQLDASDGVVSLRDAITAEIIAEGAWTSPGARFAHELAPTALAERVSAVTEPRALFEAVRARVTVRDVVLRDARGKTVGRVRSEVAVLRRGGKTRASRVAVVEVAGKTSLTAVRRALYTAGYRLAEGSAYGRLRALAGVPGAPARPRIELEVRASLRVAAAALLQPLLGVMVRNEPGVKDDVDPEYLHDYRVALRRTRTALAELKGALAADQTRAFRARFAELAALTGRVRDLDVHLGLRSRYACWVPSEFRAGLDPVFDALQRERDARRAPLLALLSSPSYATLKRDWRRALRDLAVGKAAGVASEEPAIPIARAAAAKRYRRLVAIASSVEVLDDAALHRARVQSKRLRYMLEFFAHPLGEGSTGAIAMTARAQDALGAHHDAGVLRALLVAEARRIRAADRDAMARAAALGALIARLEARHEKSSRRANARLTELTEKKSQRAFRRLLDRD